MADVTEVAVHPAVVAAVTYFWPVPVVVAAIAGIRYCCLAAWRVTPGETPDETYWTTATPPPGMWVFGWFALPALTAMWCGVAVWCRDASVPSALFGVFIPVTLVGGIMGIAGLTNTWSVPDPKDRANTTAARLRAAVHASPLFHAESIVFDNKYNPYAFHAATVPAPNNRGSQYDIHPLAVRLGDAVQSAGGICVLADKFTFSDSPYEDLEAYNRVKYRYRVYNLGTEKAAKAFLLVLARLNDKFDD